jgi:hypothetical protein
MKTRFNMLDVLAKTTGNLYTDTVERKLNQETYFPIVDAMMHIWDLNFECDS